MHAARVDHHLDRLRRRARARRRRSGRRAAAWRRAPRPRARSSTASSRSAATSLTSSVSTGRPPISRWAISSAPSASTVLTVARSRRSLGAPVSTAASSRCSGRMPERDGLAARSARGRRARPCASGSRRRNWSPIWATRWPFVALQLGLEEVHRRAADEARHEQVRRRVVEAHRRVDLLQDAAAHQRHAVAHRHRLDLVVGDVDGRRLQLVLDARDLRAHLHAQLRVQVGQRLVHQEDLRAAHDRAAHGDALALAAGERLRLAVEQLLEPDHLRDLARPAA